MKTVFEEKESIQIEISGYFFLNFDFLYALGANKTFIKAS